MGRVLDRLLELLELETIGEDSFRGPSQDLGWGTVFGGQVLGQALWAASQTVDAGRDAHSLHAYFLRPGDPARPISYHVERTRDGASFSTRRIRADQDGPPSGDLGVHVQSDSVRRNIPSINSGTPAPVPAEMASGGRPCQVRAGAIFENCSRLWGRSILLTATRAGFSNSRGSKAFISFKSILKDFRGFASGVEPRHIDCTWRAASSACVLQTTQYNYS